MISAKEIEKITEVNKVRIFNSKVIDIENRIMSAAENGNHCIRFGQFFDTSMKNDSYWAVADDDKIEALKNIMEGHGYKFHCAKRKPSPYPEHGDTTNLITISW